MKSQKRIEQFAITLKARRSGATFKEIAATLGVSITYASSLYQQAKRDELHPESDEQKQLSRRAWVMAATILERENYQGGDVSKTALKSILESKSYAALKRYRCGGIGTYSELVKWTKATVRCALVSSFKVVVTCGQVTATYNIMAKDEEEARSLATTRFCPSHVRTRVVSKA